MKIKIIFFVLLASVLSELFGNHEYFALRRDTTISLEGVNIDLYENEIYLFEEKAGVPNLLFADLKIPFSKGIVDSTKTSPLKKNISEKLVLYDITSRRLKVDLSELEIDTTIILYHHKNGNRTSFINKDTSSYVQNDLGYYFRIVIPGYPTLVYKSSELFPTITKSEDDDFEFEKVADNANNRNNLIINILLVSLLVLLLYNILLSRRILKETDFKPDPLLISNEKDAKINELGKEIIQKDEEMDALKMNYKNAQNQLNRRAAVSDELNNAAKGYQDLVSQLNSLSEDILTENQKIQSNPNASYDIKSFLDLMVTKFLLKQKNIKINLWDQRTSQILESNETTDHKLINLIDNQNPEIIKKKINDKIKNDVIVDFVSNVLVLSTEIQALSYVGVSDRSEIESLRSKVKSGSESIRTIVEQIYQLRFHLIYLGDETGNGNINLSFKRINSDDIIDRQFQTKLNESIGEGAPVGTIVGVKSIGYGDVKSEVYKKE